MDKVHFFGVEERQAGKTVSEDRRRLQKKVVESK